MRDSPRMVGVETSSTLRRWGEGQGARLGQRDRIAFLVGRGRIGVDLVEEDYRAGSSAARREFARS